MNFEYLFILETVVIFNVDTLPSQNRYLHFFEEGGGGFINPKLIISTKIFVFIGTYLKQMEFKSIWCF